MNDGAALWDRYKTYLSTSPSIGLSIDPSRMRFSDEWLASMRGPLDHAFDEMQELERGAVANRDENRMVGHYWLRDPDRAPTGELRQAVIEAIARVKEFAADVHTGRIRPTNAALFRNVLIIGIGGSALGPQLVASALTTPADKMRPFFFDNTDPDGIDRTLGALGNGLHETLVVVISKSGGTKETSNGMLEARAAFERAGLVFEKHAVAVTGEGSQLDRIARQSPWITIFPMWDWVGGRTSELSAVGLLPAALQGFDIDAMLAGARDADAVTRNRDLTKNPAAILALMWHYAGGGSGKKDMVVLPYKDRLELFSRYLQQLVMESLGKEKNRQGVVVNQGIAVYGNKGSTDQHAYVQQLREGVNNFFVTFIEVLRDRNGHDLEVEPGITAGDYLAGFFLGTRRALYDNGRESITITLDEAGARSLGALIAVFERAVGLYASLIDVNAYHQPGVEAGKKAAADVIALQHKVTAALREAGPTGLSIEELSKKAGAADAIETVFKIVEHLAANPHRGVRRQGAVADPFAARYALASVEPLSPTAR